MSQFNIADATAHFSELVQKAMLGDEVIIARDNKPLLKLVTVGGSKKDRSPGSAREKILYVAEDFDATPADFAEYS